MDITAPIHLPRSIGKLGSTAARAKTSKRNRYLKCYYIFLTFALETFGALNNWVVKFQSIYKTNMIQAWPFNTGTPPSYNFISCVIFRFNKFTYFIIIV